MRTTCPRSVLAQSEPAAATMPSAPSAWNLDSRRSAYVEAAAGAVLAVRVAEGVAGVVACPPVEVPQPVRPRPSVTARHRAILLDMVSSSRSGEWFSDNRSLSPPETVSNARRSSVESTRSARYAL
jgi:hypothetical protein